MDDNLTCDWCDYVAASDADDDAHAEAAHPRELLALEDQLACNCCPEAHLQTFGHAVYGAGCLTERYGWVLVTKSQEEYDRLTPDELREVADP